MKVEDYVHDPDRKTATIWLGDINLDELEEILKHLEFEKKKKSNAVSEHDQIMIAAIDEVS